MDHKQWGKKVTMQKCLKKNVAKTEQDALTATGGSHCVIVCGSHKNAYSRRVFLSHQLQKIICFRGKQEEETDILLGDERVRGLCLPQTGALPRWGSWACPPAHLGGCVAGQEAKGKTQRVSVRQSVSQSAMWPTQLSRKQVDADCVSQGVNWETLKASFAKIVPENGSLLSARSTKWSCSKRKHLTPNLPPGSDWDNDQIRLDV